MPNKAFTLKQGEIHEEVDTLRLVISVGTDAPWLRRSSVWKFFPRRTGTDFFVTSSALQGDMKGTVHFTQAQFGFNKPFREAMPEAWVGPLPKSRLYHTLRIRDLAEGECQHVFAVSFPGFALLEARQPLQSGKHFVRVDPQPAEYETTFGLTVVQGDWRQFMIEGEHDRFVGLLAGERDRHALISVAVRRYADLTAAIANMNRNLAHIDAKGRPIAEGDLSVLFWMERGEDDPIRMIELNGVRSNSNA